MSAFFLCIGISLDPIFILRELVKTKFNTHQLQGYLFKFSWNKGVVATSHFFWPSKHANFLENLELLDCLILKKKCSGAKRQNYNNSTVVQNLMNLNITYNNKTAQIFRAKS